MDRAEAGEKFKAKIDIKKLQIFFHTTHTLGITISLSYFKANCNLIYYNAQL